MSFLSNDFFAKLLKKKWTSEQINKYIGDFDGCFFSYAANEKFRRNAASGGSVTALISFLLNTNIIDGALVCRGIINPEGLYKGEFFIAKSEEELLHSQGSKYVPVTFAYEAMKLIKSFQGRLVVVALPCDISILVNICKKDPAINEKIRLKISLFCGHNSESALTEHAIQNIRPGDRPLIGFRHRIGNWRGKIQADFTEGHRITRPFSHFSDYQNLYFFCQRKCHHCHDHTGYASDISAGDIWSLRMKQGQIKHTVLVSRNSSANEIIEKAIAGGFLFATREAIEEVCEGQARTMPFHYNVTSRSRMSWLIGERIKDSVKEEFNLIDSLIAAIALVNEKFSRTSLGRKVIFRLPRPLLKLYLFFFKGLESIR